MQEKGINKMVLINERISWRDVFLKYTLRDALLGGLALVPSTVGMALRLLAYRLFFKRLGRGLLMKHLVTVKFPERITIGNHVGISEYTLLDGDGGITIGDYTRIASHVSIVAFSHRFADRDTPIKLQGKETRGIIIEDDVWIGTGARILDGVTLGKGCVVGAGSVVTKDVPPYAIAVGSPARVIKERHNEK